MFTFLKSFSFPHLFLTTDEDWLNGCERECGRMYNALVFCLRLSEQLESMRAKHWNQNINFSLQVYSLKYKTKYLVQFWLSKNFFSLFFIALLINFLMEISELSFEMILTWESSDFSLIEIFNHPLKDHWSHVGYPIMRKLKTKIKTFIFRFFQRCRRLKSPKTRMD